MEIEIEENREGRPSLTNLKKILLVALVYLMLVLSSKLSGGKTDMKELVGSAILNKSVIPSQLLQIFENDETFEGRWNQPVEHPAAWSGNNSNSTTDDNKRQSASGYLSVAEGYFQMKVERSITTEKEAYRLQLSIFNGEYVDGGVLEYVFFTTKWQQKYLNDTAVQISLDSHVNLTLTRQLIFITESIQEARIGSFSMVFHRADTLQVSLNFKEQHFSVSARIQLEGREKSKLRILIFAVLMMVISYVPFQAVMEMLRGIFEHGDQPRNYSLITLTLITMWDAVLCIVAFIYAFRDQESLILFFIPAFLLCLLFTNLELRMMMLIFQSLHENINLRRTLCKFNVLSYGSLFLIYPILVLTNFNYILFIFLSCILLPQIYLNGINGRAPDLSSPYYTKFILVRFLMILYLRCFPYNVFYLEPNYILTATCVCLLAGQYGLLRLQVVYGAKRLIPKWMREPVFDYHDHDGINLEEGVDTRECVICLNFLCVEPPSEEGTNGGVMKAPCQHYYHATCLIKWMQIKMECPQCRAKLPPYE